MHIVFSDAEVSPYARDRFTVSMAVLALSVCLLFVSCRGRNATKSVTDPILQSITVSPGIDTVAEKFAAQRYTAIGNYSDGSSKPLTSVTWASSDSSLAVVNSTGVVTPLNAGRVTVSATSGAITGKTTLTIEPPKLHIASEGQIPVDFSVANAMKSLYGNFDPLTQTSVSGLPTGAEKDSFFRDVKQIQAQPFYTAQTHDSGSSKVFLATYSGSLDGYNCHGCSPIIGMAAFVKTSGGWVVESSTKTALFFGEWGMPPEARILRIGPDHVGVELQFISSHQGQWVRPVSILVSWKGEIGEALSGIFGDTNRGGQCGGEDMLPCYENHTEVTFVKGTNPGYDDIVLTPSGTKLSDKPPYRVVQASGIERREFSDGKYVPAGR